MASLKRGRFAGNKEQGSNWIRRKKRLKIYERDKYQCVWCGCSLRRATDDLPEHAEYSIACLDHIVPREVGGTNDPSNLVTSCMDCNERRSTKTPLEFAADECGGCHETRDLILERVMTALGTPLAA